jgi:NAD(P)-dependent dehydrogenase (short-subunit alcohol dehydrogenase family)
MSFIKAVFALYEGAAFTTPLRDNSLSRLDLFSDQPEELVGPVLFLASRLSSHVTGVMLPVKGGYQTI